MSVWAFVLTASTLYLWAWFSSGSLAVAWMSALALLSLPQGWKWAISGGSDALGQLVLVLTTVLLLRSFKEPWKGSKNDHSEVENLEGHGAAPRVFSCSSVPCSSQLYLQW